MSKKCDDCMYYIYDEQDECYYCSINLDEDEAEKFMQRNDSLCPYFRFYDEYKMVKKQN